MMLLVVFDVVVVVVVWAAGILSMRKWGYTKSRCKHTEKNGKTNKPQFSIETKITAATNQTHTNAHKIKRGYS